MALAKRMQLIDDAAAIAATRSSIMPNQPEGPSSAIAWRRVQAGATLVVSLSLLVVLLLARELIPPVLTFGVVFLVVAAVIWRWATNRWVSVVAAVLTVLAVIGNLPFLIEDLSHPETWGSFGPAALTVLAAVTAVGAAVMAFRVAPAEGTRRYAMGAGVLGVALVALTVGLSLAASSDTAAAGDVVVVAEGAEFPEAVQIASGGTWIFLENQDLFRHTFVIEGEDVKVEMPGGKNRRVEVNLPPGEYPFICDVPGHERMEGVLTVQ